MSISQTDIDSRTVPEKPVASPRWLVEDYPGAEEDMANDIFAATYWDEYRKAEEEATKNKVTIDPNEVYVRTQFIANALTRASIQAHHLRGTAGRAFDKLVFTVKANGFYRMTREEYASLEEFLVDRLPELKDDDGERSDIIFLQSTVVPAIENLGNGTAARMIKMKDQWSKTRAAIPFLRDKAKLITGAEREFEETEKKLDKNIHRLRDKISYEHDQEKRRELEVQIQETEKLKLVAAKDREVKIAAASKEFKIAFTKAMDVITDPKIPVNGPNGVRHVLKRDAKITIFDGEKCYLQNGDVIFTLRLPKEYEAAFEAMLRHLANFKMMDGKQIITQLGQWILKKGGL